MNAQTSYHTQERGTIVSIYSGVGVVTGLTDVNLYEVLCDRSSAPIGIVIGFDSETTQVIFFRDINPSIGIYRTHQTFSIPYSDHYLGNSIDGFGRIREYNTYGPGEPKPVFRSSPGILDRKPVTIPLTTGIKCIDVTLPIGHGQRQLIIGDRKLGKTTIALDMILNQRFHPQPMACIYVAIGQKIKQVEQVLHLLQQYDALTYTTVVSATAAESLAAQYLAPFVGCTIGEYFRDNGMDALIIYDDLSNHARAYRDISLLLERSPGREAYPGDIFSLHANLLERSAQLSDKQGGGSLTAIPIVETQEGDITSYIPTNIISITDGQIYLERGLFQQNLLPAINVGLSVSRIGAQAQPPLLHSVTGGIRLALAQHKQLQKLSQLETKISQTSKQQINRGELTLSLLKQSPHQYVSWEEQLVLFYVVEHGYFDDLTPAQWVNFERLYLELIRNRYPEVLLNIHHGKFTDEIQTSIRQIVADFKQEFLVT